MVSATSESALRPRFEAAGQGHVFAHWSALDERGRARLLAALAGIDLARVHELAQLARAPAPPAPARFEPADVLPLRRTAAQQALAERARARGVELLRAGRVGYLVVAGGQASRLGTSAPKGCFPAGPLTGRSLFELHARRLLAARARHGAPTPWYVMTSDATDEPTRAYFEEQRWLGLRREDVFFLRQGMMPALDLAGRLLMASPDLPFLAPDGHGGVFAALERSGALEHARARGVEILSYFQVDNPLAPPADPLFLGLHALERARMSTKVVRKRAPGEKVGVIGRADGRTACIEYSDLPEDLRAARDERGELLYWAGNSALHAIDLAFAAELARGGPGLPWHVAQKRIACIDERGAPREVEGFKFETFVFDALGAAGRSATLEIAREREFSPIKNRTGEDSPATARRDLCRLHAGWVAAAGVALPPADAEGVHPVEVDPLLAEDEAELRARLPLTPRVLAGGHYYGA